MRILNVFVHVLLNFHVPTHHSNSLNYLSHVSVFSGLDGGKGKLPGREQAIILYDDEMNVTVVQPNEDGSYWRKIVRNKVVRMKEKRREKAAIDFMKKSFGLSKEAPIDVKSSWGPYFTTSGNAKSTGVPGLTSTNSK